MKYLFLFSFQFICIMLQAQYTMALYKDSIPNSITSKDEESSEIIEGNILIIHKVSRPTLTVYLPPKKK